MINNLSNFQATQSNITSFNKCSNKSVTVNSATVATDVCAANPKRLYAAFVNNSTALVVLVLGDRNAGAIDKGIPLNPGGSFEINITNLYRGRITAFAESDAKISVVECEE